jgi:hypothetical protein
MKQDNLCNSGNGSPKTPVERAVEGLAKRLAAGKF